MNPMDDQQRRESQAEDLDRTLDKALAEYAVVKPRAGLQERILARVRVEARQPAHSWLQWGLAGAFAAIAVIAVLFCRSNRVPLPPIAGHAPATIQGPSVRDIKPTHQDEVAPKRASMRKPAEHRVPASTAAAHPKSDQFPSPQPLSAEEIALARYVENFPKEARVVAQAQEEFELETQRVMSETGSDAPTSGSIQQER